LLFRRLQAGRPLNPVTVWEGTMRAFLICGAVLMLSVAAVAQAGEAEAPMPMHLMTNTADVQWGEAPPIFEKGASMAVMSGDPSQAGLYVVRLKMPAGYVIAPHWHPTDEHVTVISGTFALGMGKKMDKKAMTELPAGGYALLPAEMGHFAMAKTAATVQVHGMGPFELTYFNSADDPSQRNQAKK
jgi:quercetin dioxygenase-like cupin family protein